MEKIKVGDFVEYTGSHGSKYFCVVANIVGPHAYGNWQATIEAALEVEPESYGWLPLGYCHRVSKLSKEEETPEVVTCLSHFFRKIK